MSEPIMQIKAGETIIPIKTNIGRNEPINDVHRDIIDVITTEPLTPAQIEAMQTNDWEMVWDNVTQGMQTGYTEIVEYHTWFARPIGNAEQVQILNQQKQALIQEKSDLLVEKAELTEERNTLSIATEELTSNIRLMKTSVNSFLRDKKDDTLVALLALMEEWSLYDYENAPYSYTVGDVRKYNGHPYTVIQTHSTDGDELRTPELSPALWAIYHAKSAEYALPYVAPTHAEDMYKQGEYMIFDEKIYKCIVNTDRDPTVLPNSWQEVDVNGEPVEPPVEEPGNGEEPQEPVEKNSNGTDVWSEWVPWDSNPATLYKIGDRVTLDGIRYIATLDDNHWSPASGTGWTVAPE